MALAKAFTVVAFWALAVAAHAQSQLSVANPTATLPNFLASGCISPVGGMSFGVQQSNTLPPFTVDWQWVSDAVRASAENTMQALAQVVSVVKAWYDRTDDSVDSEDEHTSVKSLQLACYHPENGVELIGTVKIPVWKTAFARTVPNEDGKQSTSSSNQEGQAQPSTSQTVCSTSSASASAQSGQASTSSGCSGGDGEPPRKPSEIFLERSGTIGRPSTWGVQKEEAEEKEIRSLKRPEWECFGGKPREDR